MAYLTGFHAIEERIKAGGTKGTLLVAKPGPRAQEIVLLARARGIRTDRVGNDDLDHLAPEHRGLALEVPDTAARAEDRERSLESFLAGLKETGAGAALVVILDEITDPHNYGAIIRSCDQFGVDLVLTRRRRIANRGGGSSADVIARASSGAAAWVPVVETANLARAVEDLKAAGFWIYGADMNGEILWTKDLSGRVVLIFGGEGSGLSHLLRENCDGIIAIPGKGRIDSLNVSVAAGVLLYEVTRQRA
jgi:23S rRNA (guanosine2251-2'-O)-methyltransferase